MQDLHAEIARLNNAIERLAGTVEQMRGPRRTRPALVVASLMAAVAGFGVGTYGVPYATAQSAPSALAAPRDPAAVAAAREALLQQLTPAKRQEVEAFERDAGWLSQYMRLYGDQFDAGAMIALMLGRMVGSVAAVPDMRTEMQIMNAKMNALPVMAAEMQGMNAKMGIMAAGMDSTMGRAGRMMPWAW